MSAGSSAIPPGVVVVVVDPTDVLVKRAQLDGANIAYKSVSIPATCKLYLMIYLVNPTGEERLDF